MMDELLSRVTERTGLSPEQAKSAVETVLGFLKEKLPAPLATGLSACWRGRRWSCWRRRACEQSQRSGWKLVSEG
jgi:Bacterial nucleoid DNA-binding protein